MNNIGSISLHLKSYNFKILKASSVLFSKTSRFEKRKDRNCPLLFGKASLSCMEILGIWIAVKKSSAETIKVLEQHGGGAAGFWCSCPYGEWIIKGITRR